MRHLDTFTRSYLETALWSSTGDGGEPLDRRYTADDFAPAALEQAVRECEAFQDQAAALSPEWLESDRQDRDQAGHDFWLTRNGHGAGFWDGDWPLMGDKLTDMARSFGERNVYVGDDGLLYFYEG